jgi:hypothetical protein
MIMQLKFKGCGLQRAVGYWAFAILCGSAAAACSGTIETPSEENPPARAGNDDDDDGGPEAIEDEDNATGNDDDDDGPAPTLPVGDDEDEEEDPPPPPAGNGEDEEEEPPAPPAASGEVSFANDVWPIFQANCAPCHTAQDSGDQSVGNDDVETALEDAIRIEDALISDLETGRMPYGCGEPPGGGGTCISAQEFQTIEEWYAAGTPE